MSGRTRYYLAHGTRDLVGFFVGLTVAALADARMSPVIFVVLIVGGWCLVSALIDWACGAYRGQVRLPRWRAR